MSIRATDLTPLIGSEISADRATLLDGQHSDEIRKLLDQRGVLIFPSVFLDDDEQMAFTSTLGELVDRPDRKPDKISLNADVTALHEQLRAAQTWHFDGCFEETPPGLSMLGARRLSDSGGLTEFCNLYAAYEALSDADKRLIAPLRVVHDREFWHRPLFPEPTETQLARMRSTQPRSHPLVWTHRSGRKSLVLGAAASRVEGMGEHESRELIERLQAWATEPQFVYSHKWNLGDLLMWDNHGVLHRVTPYPPESRRLLFRAAVEGKEVPA